MSTMNPQPPLVCSAADIIPANNIIFHLNDGLVEVLKITPTEFFVRGVKVEQGEGEAKAVYDAFCEWLQKSKQESLSPRENVTSESFKVFKRNVLPKSWIAVSKDALNNHSTWIASSECPDCMFPNNGHLQYSNGKSK